MSKPDYSKGMVYRISNEALMFGLIPGIMDRLKSWALANPGKPIHIEYDFPPTNPEEVIPPDWAAIPRISIKDGVIHEETL